MHQIYHLSVSRRCMSLCRSLANLFACGVRPEMLDGGGAEEEEQVRAKANTTPRAEKGYQIMFQYVH